MLFIQLIITIIDMKKFLGILTLFCLLTAIPAAAQFNFGIKAGVNLSQKPTIASDNNVDKLISDLKGNTGWFIGPTAKFIFPVVGLGVEANVLYSQTNVGIEGQNILNQNIDIPLYLRYELRLPIVSKYIEPFIAIGPQFSWNIGDKEIDINNIGDINLGNISVGKYKLDDSSFSLNFGLGLILFDHLQIHGNYNLALGNTAELQLANISNIIETRTNTWQISLAYIF